MYMFSTLIYITSFAWIQHGTWHSVNSSFAFLNYLQFFMEYFQITVGCISADCNLKLSWGNFI